MSSKIVSYTVIVVVRLIGIWLFLFIILFFFFFCFHFWLRIESFWVGGFGVIWFVLRCSRSYLAICGRYNWNWKWIIATIIRKASPQSNRIVSYGPIELDRNDSQVEFQLQWWSCTSNRCSFPHVCHHKNPSGLNLHQCNK